MAVKTKKPGKRSSKKGRLVSDEELKNATAQFTPSKVMSAAAKVASAQIMVERTRCNLRIAQSKLTKLKESVAQKVRDAEEIVDMFRNELAKNMLNHTEAVGAMQMAGQLPQPVP